MKASTKVKMAVLAGALLALVAIPAAASAHMVEVQDMAGAAELVAESKPVAEAHLAIDTELMRETLQHAEAVELAGGEGPFPDGGGEAAPSVDEFPEENVFPDGHGEEVVPRDEPEITGDGDDGVVVTQDTTPSITTTSTRVPRRPDLPFTGGNTLGFVLAGIAVGSLGVALAAAGYGAGRRSDAQ